MSKIGKGCYEGNQFMYSVIQSKNENNPVLSVRQTKRWSNCPTTTFPLQKKMWLFLVLRESFGDSGQLC